MGIYTLLQSSSPNSNNSNSVYCVCRTVSSLFGGSFIALRPNLGRVPACQPHSSEASGAQRAQTAQEGGGVAGGRGCRVILGRQSSKKEVTAHNLGFVLLTFIVFPFNPCGGVGRDANRPTQEESNWLRSESKSIAPRGGIPPQLNPTFSCNLTPEQREWSLCRKALNPKKLDCRHERNSVLMSFRSD